MADAPIRYPYTGEGLRGIQRLAAHRPPERLIALYRSMLRIRRIEEEIERRYHDDHMKTPIHLVIGQEATAVGCAAAMRDDDLLYTSHRTHGGDLAEGGALNAMHFDMHWPIHGLARGRCRSMD